MFKLNNEINQLGTDKIDLTFIFTQLITRLLLIKLEIPIKKMFNTLLQIGFRFISHFIN